MKSRDHDPYDSPSVLSSWENEGGAPAALPDAKGRYAPDDIFHRLGQSVVTHWNELPHSFKQTVFREIESGCDGPYPGLKERAARYLHENSGLQVRDRKHERRSQRVSPPRQGTIHDSP